MVRQTLMHLLQGDPEIELMGSAPNPLIAGPVIRKTPPDVLLLDIEITAARRARSLRGRRRPRQRRRSARRWPVCMRWP